MNILAKFFGGSYDDLWKAVIRPPRDEYEDTELGPEKFNIKGKNYKRTDITLTNQRNQKLFCSFWEPYDEEREYDRLPCVVYLHGNSSSRAEAVPEVKYLLPMNVTLFSFDFAGCGRSEGDYISLGWYEREDVECVIEYLRKSVNTV
jgi:cephalosporin-C deacetylase-like acetyl esterase